MSEILIGIIMCILIAGCQPPSDQPVKSKIASAQKVTNESNYKKSVIDVLNESQALMGDKDLNEQRLDAGIKKIELLIALGKTISGDTSKFKEAELLSTLGAMYARKAAFNSTNPRKAGTYISVGFRYLDRAIIKYPENITARINRGITASSVPEFMHKTDVAKEDLTFVIHSSSFANLPSTLRNRIMSTLDKMHTRIQAKKK